jgi:hypothetical protein
MLGFANLHITNHRKEMNKNRKTNYRKIVSHYLAKKHKVLQVSGLVPRAG